MRSRSWSLVQPLKEVKKCFSYCNRTNRYSGCLHRHPVLACVKGTKNQCKIQFYPAYSPASADFLCKTRYVWLFMTESGRGVGGFPLNRQVLTAWIQLKMNPQVKMHPQLLSVCPGHPLKCWHFHGVLPIKRMPPWFTTRFVGAENSQRCFKIVDLSASCV